VLPIRERWTRRRQACRRLWNKIRPCAQASRSPRIAASDLPRVEWPLEDNTFGELNVEKNVSTEDMSEDKSASVSHHGLPSSYVSAYGSQAPVIARYRSHQEVVATVQALHDTIQLAPVSSRVSRNRVIIPGREYDVPDDAVPKIRDSQEEGIRRGPDVAQTSPSTTKDALFPNPAAQDDCEDPQQPKRDHATWYRTPLNILKLTLTPPSISLFLALPISLVQPLKALFVNVEGWSGGRIPYSPDGKPPLSWLLDVSS
jgi:hypothetical protein